MTDPGFPRKGGNLVTKVQRPIYYLDQFLQKTASKWKKMDREEGYIPGDPWISDYTGAGFPGFDSFTSYF